MQNAPEHEEFIEYGTNHLSLDLDGDFPGASGWVGINEYKGWFLVITEEECYGPYSSFREALDNDVFDYIHMEFTTDSDVLDRDDVSKIDLEVRERSSKTRLS
ncbi:hypothetical protein [Robertkochia sediminum]|uniref:hypothetical protein n=1 Tax=Robertkochia sediminum TaxID=2785326 RepID=UPI00193495C2|nr:hypothetical protein [Robertkochia sediminum]MBL7471366.1 hypothetical protein [Robertkochia sediminum]